MKRKFFCVLLALILCAGMLPAAMAAEAPSQTEPVTESSAPVVTETPAETEQPGEDGEILAEPESLAEPSVTEAPAETEIPAETEQPVAPEQPAATQTPADTTSTTEETLTAAFDGEGVPGAMQPSGGSPSSGTSFTSGSDVSVESAGVYSTNLDAAVYSATLTGIESIAMARAMATPGGAAGRTLSNGSRFVIGEENAGDYNFTVSGTGSFKIEKLTDLSGVAVALTVNQAQSVDASKIYSFTSINGGTYTLVRDNSVHVSAMCGFRYQGDSLELESGTTIYIEFNASGSVRLLDTNSMSELKVGETTTISSDGLYKLSITSVGWYVLEPSGVTLRSTTSNGREANQFIAANEKYYVYCTDTMGELTFSFDVTGSGSVAVRAAQPSDFKSVAWNDTAKTATVSGIGLYCLSATEAGAYKVELAGEPGNTGGMGMGGMGNQGNATVFNGVKSVSTGSLTSLNAGGCLYVYIKSEDAPCTISKQTDTALEHGEEITIAEHAETECYYYDVPAGEGGLYCFLANDAVNITTPKDNVDTYGWRFSNMSAGFRLIPLTAGERVYFYISGSEKAATLKFDKQEKMISALPLNEEKTGGTGHTGWRFEPTDSGVYIVSAEGESGDYTNRQDSKIFALLNQDEKQINGQIAMEMEGGQTYFIFTSKPNAKVRVQKLEALTAKPLTLNKEEESDDALAVYTFDVPSTGFYTVTYENAEISTYEASIGLQSLGNNNGMGMGQSQPQSVSVALEGGKKISFVVKKVGDGKPSVEIGQADGNSVRKLMLGTNDDVAGTCTFTPTEAGVYIIRNVNAEVFAENNGNRKTASGYQPAIFRLDAGQTAYITVEQRGGGARPGEQGSNPSVTIEKDTDFVVDLMCDEKKEYSSATMFRFTAPADGLYMVSLPDYGRVTGAEFYDTGMYQRHMLDGVDLFMNRSFICDLKKGESVYVWASITDANQMRQKPTVLAQEVTGLEALEGIKSTFLVGITAEDVRESVKVIGASRLLQAMQEDGAKTVAAMAALENDTETLNMDGELTTTVADNAGVETVTIIGAKLNDLAEENKTVTLTVAADKTERALPEELDTDSAVYLTIDLDGVESTSKLAVPVCLTVAVPADMDAQSVRLVHYGADKTELLDPIDVYEADGTWYARFAVGGFSPFALAETATSSSGGNASGTGSAKGQSPKTGDSAMPVLYLVIAVAAIAAVVAIVVVRKKRK